MKAKISEDLITISTRLMTARERGEIIHLAGELNSVIEKAMEIEEKGTYNLPDKERKTLSASIKFTREEVEKMSKTFKKEFIANGCVGHVIKRPSGKRGSYYEIRYRRNGFNITVSNVDLKTTKNLFIEATKNLDKANTSKRLTFNSVLNEWLEYKKGKVIEHTLNNCKSRAERYIPDWLKNKDIKEIRTSDIDGVMNGFKSTPRTYEEMRTIFNGVFKYAKASGIITYNPVELVPFKRAERTNRKAMTEEQIKEFFTRLAKPEFERIRQSTYVLYFFGLRPCEIDNETRFENGFLICRNRKRKGGKIEYKKIPVPVQAQEYINFNKPLTFPCCYTKTLPIIKNALGNGLTPYNLRHTFATQCAKAVRPEIVEVWMGDSPDRLVGKTYIHYPDDFMKEQMSKVEFIT